MAITKRNSPPLEGPVYSENTTKLTAPEEWATQTGEPAHAVFFAKCQAELVDHILIGFDDLLRGAEELSEIGWEFGKFMGRLRQEVNR